MVLVRRHSGPGRVKFEGEVYEWGQDGVLDVADGQAAVRLVRSHGDLSFDAPATLHHDPDAKGNREEPSGSEEE